MLWDKRRFILSFCCDIMISRLFSQESEYNYAIDDNLSDSDHNQDTDYNDVPVNGFDSKVFWSVNAFIFVLICLTGAWCCFVQRYFSTDRMHSSEENCITRQRRRQEAARTESPEKRRRKLEASFSNHGVQMVRSSICVL